MIMMIKADIIFTSYFHAWHMMCMLAHVVSKLVIACLNLSF